MAAVRRVPVAEDYPSDEEITQLLQRAERRLRRLEAFGKDVEPEEVMLSPSQNGVVFPRIPKLKARSLDQPYITSINGVARADAHRLHKNTDGKAAGNFQRMGDSVQMRGLNIQAHANLTHNKKATGDQQWFDLSRTRITPEVKRDLQLLKMRGVLDPKRHYKKENSRALDPEFSQVGTIVEGPTEYFSARIPNKERKKTLLEEVLASETSTGRFKSKYNEIQAINSNRKKAYYKKLKARKS
ncbi:MAG: hypothetical protein Q9217_006889 [Psora testacea]